MERKTAREQAENHRLTDKVTFLAARRTACEALARLFGRKAPSRVPPQREILVAVPDPVR